MHRKHLLALGVLGAVVAVLLLPVAGQAAASPPNLVWSPTTTPTAPTTFTAGSSTVPAILDFGTVIPGSNHSQQLTLTNSGGTATSALTFTLSGNTSKFSITGNACSATSLGPKKQCTLTVTYTETALGASDTATLTAVSKKPAATVKVTLKGATGKASTSLTSTPGGDVVLGSGAQMTDSAVLSGGSSPTGTLTFNLFAPGEDPAVSLPVHSDTLPVSGNGTYNSGGYTPTAPGTYEWIAVYSGDSTNAGSQTNVGDEPETATATTDLQITKSGSPATQAVGPPYLNITWTMVVTNNGPNADTNVQVHDPMPAGNTYVSSTTTKGSCTGGAVLICTLGTMQAGDQVTITLVTTPTITGLQTNTAVVTGDLPETSTANNTASASVMVHDKATPSINTRQQPASATVGSSIADQATVSGGINPTGTVTFNLYDNPNGTGTLLFTDTEPLAGGTATSAGYTTTATGTDYWVATYNGDSNNNPVSSGTADEPVTISPATPSITAGGRVASCPGEPLSATATVSGGYNPTGTVTFNLYPPLTGPAVYTETDTLSGGTASTHGGTAPSAPGDYHWVATYNGDSNNNSVSSNAFAFTVTSGCP
jgi:uncharacterized repeat protein (TIGR01451 family)